MGICKYFLQNRCNFGDRCRFEHVYPDQINQPQRRNISYNNYDSGRKGNIQATVYHNYNQRDYNYQRDYSQRDYNQREYNNYREHNQGSPRGRQDDRYHYNRNTNPQQQQRSYQSEVSRFQPQHQADSSYDAQGTSSYDEAYSMIKYEINQMERGNMWMLTSFGPLRHLGSFPDWYDYSPEEVRWAAYVAQQQNTQDKYTATLELLSLQAKLLRDKLRLQSKETIGMVDQYLKQSAITIHPLEMDVFRSASSAVIPDNSFVSPFRTAANEAEMDDTPLTNVPASSTFFGSVPPAQTNIFGSVPPPSTNLFGSVPLAPQTNIFGSVTAQPPSGFGQSIFGSQGASSNIFGTPQNSSQSADTQSKLEFMDEDLDYKILSAMWKGDDYSDPNNLTDDEMAQFKAAKFTYGHVPIVPPPKELC